MPVELVEGWPDPRPMSTARRNGTHILIAFEGRPGTPPWTVIARWVIPVQRTDEPISKRKMDLFQKRGGYWSTGWKNDRPVRSRPLGWWEVPTMEPGEIAE